MKKVPIFGYVVQRGVDEERQWVAGASYAMGKRTNLNWSANLMAAEYYVTHSPQEAKSEGFLFPASTSPTR